MIEKIHKKNPTNQQNSVSLRQTERVDQAPLLLTCDNPHHLSRQSLKFMTEKSANRKIPKFFSLSQIRFFLMCIIMRYPIIPLVFQSANLPRPNLQTHKGSFLVIENERFRLVFAKTGSINSGRLKEVGVMDYFFISK